MAQPRSRDQASRHRLAGSWWAGEQGCGPEAATELVREAPRLVDPPPLADACEQLDECCDLIVGQHEVVPGLRDLETRREAGEAVVEHAADARLDVLRPHPRRATRRDGNGARCSNERRRERIQRRELIGVALARVRQHAFPQPRARGAAEARHLDLNDRDRPAPRDRMCARGKHEASQLALDEVEPIRRGSDRSERIDRHDHWHTREQLGLARQLAELATSFVAGRRESARIDHERRSSRGRGEQAASARPDATVRDHDAIARDGAARLVDGRRRDLELGKSRCVGDEAGDLRELGVEREVAVREREHAGRELECLTMFRRGRHAVGTLDQAERPQRRIGSELAPYASASGMAIDDAANDVEGDIADVLGRGGSQRRAHVRIELVREEQPQDAHLRLGEREPRLEQQHRQLTARRPRRLHARRQQAHGLGEQVLAQLCGDREDVSVDELFGRLERNGHAAVIGRRLPELRRREYAVITTR
jgi:hypothetical protein